MIPLLILGLLKQFPGAHGYELLALMEERHYKYIVSFTKGSFYYNLQQLETKGWIKQIENPKEGREANHYEITELGDRAFDDLMVKYGSKSEYVNLSFYGAMLFADAYDAKAFEALIDSQIDQTETKIKLLTQSIEGDASLTDAYRKMLENSRAHHEVNVAWFKSLKIK